MKTETEKIPSDAATGSAPEDLKMALAKTRKALDLYMMGEDGDAEGVLNDTGDVALRYRAYLPGQNDLLEIVDENGKPLEIGMRVGCRNKGQSRSWSRRGLTLTGYEPGTDEPYITNAGRFALAIKDHQPDMDNWIDKHVSR